jgi:hypothetical protein
MSNHFRTKSLDHILAEMETTISKYGSSSNLTTNQRQEVDIVQLVYYTALALRKEIKSHTEGSDLAGSNRNSDTAQANPPLSAPTNTDELDEILTQLENAVARDIQLRLTQHRSGRSPKSSHAEAKAKIARLIALKQREELEQALADYKKMHPSIVHPYYLKLLDRIAELNTIIGSSDELT